MQILDNEQNWLQSSSDNVSDLDHDQFLLNTNDMYSDEAWSSYSDSDTHGNNIAGNDDFETNDQYIDDELIPHNSLTSPVLEPSPGPVELYDTTELDHYFLDPEGLNLIDPFAIPQGQPNNDTVHGEDPEPSPGPFDPG